MRMRRTDLALEARELWQEGAGGLTALPGVEARDALREGIPVNTVKILDGRGEEALGKPRGTYVTLTLEGAIWNKDKMLLSFAIDGADIPKDVPSDIYLNRDVMQVTLAESQRETYVRSETVELERPLSESRAPRTQAELDASVQDQLKRGEPRLFHLPTLVRSGGGLEAEPARWPNTAS